VLSLQRRKVIGKKFEWAPIIEIALGIVLGFVLLYAPLLVVLVTESAKTWGEKFNRISGSQRFWRVTMTVIFAAFEAFLMIGAFNSHVFGVEFAISLLVVLSIVGLVKIMWHS
jgi:ABC-type sulfate transport system permease subunit